MPPQDSPPCHIDQFKKLQKHEKLRKPSRSYPFLRDIYIYLHLYGGKTPFVRVFPSPSQEEEAYSLSLEIGIYGEGNDFDLHNNPTLVYCVFPVTSH